MSNEDVCVGAYVLFKILKTVVVRAASCSCTARKWTKKIKRNQKVSKKPERKQAL